MALIHHHQSIQARPDTAAPIRAPLPLAALDRLAGLHGEASRTTRQGVFLGSAANAAGALLLFGIAALAFAADTSLPLGFAWSLLVVAGIGALLRSYIRSTAAFDRVPVAEAVRELRLILLYAGFAWGLGAFLLLPGGSIVLLLFAGLPSLSLSRLLKDRDGTLAFLLPVTALSLAASLARPSGAALLETALLMILQGGIAARCILRSRDKDSFLPAGLALRR